MKEMFNNVFDGKTVLITGHTGFMGSWLSIWLNELGAKVVGYGLEPYTEKDNFVVTNLDDKITSVIGDIRDYERLLKVFEEYKPDIAFHLAAQALVCSSYEEPKETYDVNIGGTVNFFEAVRMTNACKVAINVTSDKCYENKEWVWGYRENDPVGGHDPYSSSKGCSELVTAAYRRSFFNLQNIDQQKKAIASVRVGNVIGGGDWRENRLIPDCIRALKKHEKIKVRNPKSTRPWQHVLEPLRGYLVLASRMYNDAKGYSGPWNLGPEYRAMCNVGEVVKKVIEFWNKGDWEDVSKSNLNERHEAKLLRLDISKAVNYLGWRPILSMSEVIRLTTDWYQAKNVDYRFDVKQIEGYISKVRINNIE